MKFLHFLRSLSTLQLALAVSVLVHAVVLSIRFVDPEAFDRVFEDTPLEVILVNSQTKEAPDKAQVIAQANLAGGGESANTQERATSPLPYSAMTNMGNDFEERQRQIDAMQAQQMQLLAQLRNQLAQYKPPDTRKATASQADIEQEEKHQQLVKMLAEIEKRIHEENARPKKRYISPATREEVYALYYDALRRKVEERGTANFPEAGGKKLYGELIMIMTVNYDGRVLGTEVYKSSGNQQLDRRAEAIAVSAGPFGHFGPALRAKADQIAVVSRFRFTRDQVLETANLQ
ncbi:energy transducer TonB [Comamonas sp. J-3]|uniref:energy transducer TonB n=1 Tax=Comamonas trifloxystrobinivorans TaxID=3350256 RepID=UPI003726FD6E